MTFTAHTETGRIILRQDDVYEAEIYPFGALLNRFSVKLPDGTLHNSVAAYTSPEDAQHNITRLFRSAKLSPFACRLADAAYTFDGRNHRVGKFMLDGSAIHGLIYDAPFEIQNIRADADRAEVVLFYAYCQSEAGYPFDYQIHIRYRLEAGGRLALSSRIHNTGSTTLPLADGWHPYFAVDGHPDDWRLTLRSNTQLAFDDRLLPTGHTVSDGRFIQGSTLGGIHLDNCYIVDTDRKPDEPAAVLQGKAVSLAVIPDTSYPYLQVFIPPEHDSIAIENLSGAPDCFNNGIGLIRLAPDETRSFQTVYRLRLDIS